MIRDGIASWNMKTIKKCKNCKLLKRLIRCTNLFFFTLIIRRNVILLQRNNMQIYQPYISFGGVMSGTKWGRQREGERRQRPKATDGQ